MSQTAVLQNAQTANVNGLTFEPDIFGGGKILVEVRETAGGTATLTFEGSFDGSNWYGVAFQQVDSATLTRTVTPLSVTANLAHVYQIIEEYPQVRARISSVASGATLTVKAYGTAT